MSVSVCVVASLSKTLNVCKQLTMCQTTKVMWHYGKRAEGRKGKSPKEVYRQVRLDQVQNIIGMKKRHEAGEKKEGRLGKYIRQAACCRYGRKVRS